VSCRAVPTEMRQGESSGSPSLASLARVNRRSDAPRTVNKHRVYPLDVPSMAAHHDEGVPLSIAHDLSAFRLLELPPELVELLEAPNPPLYAAVPPPIETVLTPVCRLSIKSQPPPASTIPNAKPAYAVLCTPNKAFQLRQVQTSNSLFVTRPTLEAHGNAEPVPTTCAVALCTATLELHPAVESAVPYLENALPVYQVVGGEIDAEENRRTKASIFSNVPLSDAQCEQAWKELVAFEFKGSSYRPSADALVKVWQSINSAALAEGIQLDSQFLANHVAKLVEEEGHPASLAVAILRLLAAAGEDNEAQWSSLERTRTVAFMGKTILEARRGKPDLLTAEFLDTWRDCLPEPWRADAELKAINGAFTLPSSSTICTKGNLSATTAPAAPAKGKGKWHERLGQNRKK
jgi:sister chromatid cohesion protein DCC1